MSVNNAEVNEALLNLWRAYPDHPSTFVKCLQCKDRSGRGGGPCRQCCEENLAKEVGEVIAKEMHNAVAKVRKLEKACRDEFQKRLSV